jgi:hypothetical protein
MFDGVWSAFDLYRQQHSENNDITRTHEVMWGREGGPQGKVTQLFADVLHSAPVNTLMTEGTYIIVLCV